MTTKVTLMPDANQGEANEVDLLIRWMERGCPVYLDEQDDIARPLGDCRIAAGAYTQGLAALDGIKQDGMVWRRVKHDNEGDSADV